MIPIVFGSVYGVLGCFNAAVDPIFSSYGPSWRLPREAPTPLAYLVSVGSLYRQIRRHHPHTQANPTSPEHHRNILVPCTTQSHSSTLQLVARLLTCILKALVWFWLIDETYWTNPMSKCVIEIGWSKSK